MSVRPADHGPGTRAVHAGLPAPAQGEPFLPGPTFAGPYHLAGDADSHRYGYQRYGNPTWTRYEAALSELEHGPAIIFPAGMSAVTAILMELLEPGDRLVAPSDAYPGVRDVAASHLVPAGVDVQLVPTDDAAIREAIRDGASLVWVEVPSNPALDVIDIAALAADVHAAGALLAVDNTLATPLSQRPLELGADLSMSSATKALTGHADLNLGHVASRDDRHAEALMAWRSRTGAIPGPFEVWLAHRSLATLDVRLERQCANALAIAEALQADERVVGVRYPGLPGHPGHEVAARQMDRFGMVLGFELADADAAQRFLTAAELVAEATSFGGVHTTAERRARWGTDAVSEGFIRMSAGLEDEDDLVADVLRAVDAASSSRTT